MLSCGNRSSDQLGGKQRSLKRFNKTEPVAGEQLDGWETAQLKEEKQAG